ncbi:MAG: hypothetical protein ABIN91_11280 [Mucilaginibacter sp.]|uniref:hypothetical protein n=1 Tax=Mucilaginibacter sp. TaxID=1882438 RepID=UPI003263AEC4
MKKMIFAILIFTIVALSSCKKKDDTDTVALDMTLKTYSADAKNGTLYTTLLLKFNSDGTVKLYDVTANDDGITLKYEVGDKMASNTTLHIFGQIDKTFYADGLTKGTKIDWTSNIERFNYRPTVYTITIGGYYFK